MTREQYDAYIKEGYDVFVRPKNSRLPWILVDIFRGDSGLMDYGVSKPCGDSSNSAPKVALVI